VAGHLGKIDLPAIGKFSAPRGHERQAVLAEGKALDIVGQRVLGGESKIGRAGGNGVGDVDAFALFNVDIDVRIFAQEGSECPRQMLRQAGRIGEQKDAGAQAGGKAEEIAAHRLHIVDHEPCMIEQALAGRSQLDAAAAALEQGNAKRLLKPLDAGAGGGERKVGAVGAAGDAAVVCDRDEKLQVDQVETHGRSLVAVRKSAPAFAIAECWLRNLHIVRDRELGQPEPMTELQSFLILIAAIFMFAGFIKGVLGLGLPTVSMGLLAVTMVPTRALAIVIVPAVVTNIWQTFAGPHLPDIVRRLWPLLAGTVIGAWLNAGAMTGPYAHYIPIALGVVLVIYAVMGLSRIAFTVARRDEKWIGGIVGIITGMISVATGVQVVPSMPFMQALGMEKDELVQALGLFFTVATLALSINLTHSGALSSAIALPGAIALAASFAGMFVGQRVRSKMPAEAFRRWFLIGMVALGIYLAAGTLLGLTAA